MNLEQAVKLVALDTKTPGRARVMHKDNQAIGVGVIASVRGRVVFVNFPPPTGGIACDPEDLVEVG